MKNFNYLKNQHIKGSDYDYSEIDNTINDLEVSLFDLPFISDDEPCQCNCGAECKCEGVDEACSYNKKKNEASTKEIEVNKKAFDNIQKKSGSNAPEKYFKTASKLKRDPLTWKKIKTTKPSSTSKKQSSVDEENTSSAVAGYNTPRAFLKNPKNNPDLENNDPKNFKYGEKASRTNIHFKKLENKILNTESKRQPTPKDLVNMNIKEINRLVRETERKIKYNVFLKQESGLTNEDYWKPTRQKLIKMSESLLNIAKMIKELKG